VTSREAGIVVAVDEKTTEMSLPLCGDCSVPTIPEPKQTKKKEKKTRRSKSWVERNKKKEKLWR